jgi:acetyl-CoA carboxylase carboxyl transferase subunit alpha
MTKMDFEKPILDLEAKIAELRKASSTEDLNISDEIQRMQNKVRAYFSKPIAS